MTTAELQTTADRLADVDQQLAALPADGRVAQEIKSLREIVADVRKVVANALRGQ
jgi:hypothetical protein